METIWLGIREAIRLLIQRDPYVWEITALTLRVSGTATLVAVLLGVPIGILLAFSRFPGRRLLVAAVNTGMGLPPVVVGLVVALFLWRSGPLGFLRLIYTPTAMIIAQALLAWPIVTGLTMAAIQQLDPGWRWQLLGLGASRLQMVLLLLWETRLLLLAAVIAAFGAVISEVGASMMVGGNIAHHTRVLTTATVLETSKGNFALAMALSTILLALAYIVTYALTTLQQRSRRM
ncbi:MAG: ABC transporter permease subunit [Chloroflexi bacterium]|nr:ABC transporter permease subunit [Chloroflexota bacterium]